MLAGRQSAVAGTGVGNLGQSSTPLPARTRSSHQQNHPFVGFQDPPGTVWAVNNLVYYTVWEPIITQGPSNQAPPPLKVYAPMTKGFPFPLSSRFTVLDDASEESTTVYIRSMQYKVLRMYIHTYEVQSLS